MLLNASSPVASGQSSPDGPLDTARAAPTHAPAASGRALLSLLELQAQQELAAMLAAQADVPPPQVDRERMWLAWDLGLTGEQVDLP